MDLFQAERQAKMLMVAHGVGDWTFKFDGAKKRAGQTKFATKTISLSRHLTSLMPVDEVRDTVLHEIAHALAGHAAGHGPEWQRIAKSIGCNGQRTYTATAETSVPHTWVGVCPVGHVVGKRYRRPSQKRSCGKCSDVYDERYMISWKRP
jgi:SprT protein